MTDAADYTGPILAVAGSEDTVVDASVFQAFVDVVDSPEETLRIINGADHIYNVLT